MATSKQRRCVAAAFRRWFWWLESVNGWFNDMQFDELVHRSFKLQPRGGVSVENSKMNVVGLLCSVFSLVRGISEGVRWLAYFHHPLWRQHSTAARYLLRKLRLKTLVSEKADRNNADAFVQ